MAGMIQRYVFPLCVLDDVGLHEATVKCGAQAFRADTLRANVTAPGQAFIEQLDMAGSPQLFDECDAWEFSFTAEQEMRDAWFRERGTTEAEWLARAEAREAVDEDKMRREEAGEEVDWGDEEDDEDEPPCAPRLAFPTVVLGNEVRLKVRYVSKIHNDEKLAVLLTGFADDGVP
jgi:hypothetical protein